MTEPTRVEAKQPRGPLPDWQIAEGHPLRRVKDIADDELVGMASELVVAGWSSKVGPRRLLNSALLMVLYNVRDTLQLCDQLDYNLLFRWFLDMTPSEPVPDPDALAEGLQGLLALEAPQTFLRSVMETIVAEGLLHSHLFNIDRARLRDWVPSIRRDSSVVPAPDPRLLGSDGDTCAPGRFSWLELRATEPSEAKAFYCALFGWSSRELPSGPRHGLFERNGDIVASIHELPRLQRMVGVQPHWTPYVCVDDVEEVTLRARTLGGEFDGPFEALDGGRSAVLVDSMGAQLGLWQPTSAAAPVATNALGTACWYEIVTDDTARARYFYGALFGWGGKTARGASIYTSWTRDGLPIAGIRGNEPERVGTPTQWMVYFAEADIETRVRQAVKLGGQIVIPPTEIGDGDYMAVLTDPQGATFGLLQRDGEGAPQSAQLNPVAPVSAPRLRDG